MSVQALLAQIDAWPCDNIALDWLSDPERHVALICRAMDGAAPVTGTSWPASAIAATSSWPWRA